MSMATPSDISDPQITLIASAVRGGTAEKEDALRLLELFCTCVDERKPIPSQLLDHVRDCFRAILDGGRYVYPEPTWGESLPPKLKPCSVETALGLAKRKGRPPAEEQVRMQMAGEVLDYRLEGESHEVALEKIAELFECGRSVIAEAWAEHMGIAIVVVQTNRSFSPWTPIEMERLRKIYDGVPGVITTSG
ncbi:MAG: hypothetical protein HQL37_05435 [Alphaproteobacteria bacterium]|nr:hypothetical protein [Alphaproteobacteria bacterium]